MTPSLPRLRSDLIVRPQQTTQGTCVVIKNPESRKFFRLGEAEYFIAKQLDGETSMEVIRQRAEATFGAACVTITSWSDFRQELHRLYFSWASIAVVLALNFLVVGAHEFGHGLTCTRFGGEVHEMGCALVFLQPAFYCNVSDAWLFPEKSKRLWVGIAGPYFELLLWSLAVLTWRLTEPDTWINFITLSVMATSGVKSLLNLNPLIKLDGYYLLSDYLEIPNLRRRSFRYGGSLVEKLFGLESLEEEEVLPRRERAIFSVYGTLALAGSFSILGLSC